LWPRHDGPIVRIPLPSMLPFVRPSPNERDCVAFESLVFIEVISCVERTKSCCAVSKPRRNERNLS
jgi:hypothetical protein